jgi:high-affinity Fe2+/Pb2+ permease
MVKFEILFKRLLAGDGYVWLGLLVAIVLGWAIVEVLRDRKRAKR